VLFLTAYGTKETQTSSRSSIAARPTGIWTPCIFCPLCRTLLTVSWPIWRNAAIGDFSLSGQQVSSNIDCVFGVFRAYTLLFSLGCTATREAGPFANGSRFDYLDADPQYRLLSSRSPARHLPRSLELSHTLSPSLQQSDSRTSGGIGSEGTVHV